MRTIDSVMNDVEQYRQGKKTNSDTQYIVGSLYNFIENRVDEDTYNALKRVSLPHEELIFALEECCQKLNKMQKQNEVN